MHFGDLTPEQREKADACESGEELLALAKEEGVELEDAELEQISGGSYYVRVPDTCPLCGRKGTVEHSIMKGYDWWCNACRRDFVQEMDF